MCQLAGYAWNEAQLNYLVSGSVSQTWEEREELAGYRCLGKIPEDDAVELGDSGDLCRVAHQSLRNGVDGVEDGKLGDTSTS